MSLWPLEDLTQTRLQFFEFIETRANNKVSHDLARFRKLIAIHFSYRQLLFIIPTYIDTPPAATACCPQSTGYRATYQRLVMMIDF